MPASINLKKNRNLEKRDDKICFCHCLLSLCSINKVHFPAHHSGGFITAGSSESRVIVLKLNSHMFIMKANPDVCSERKKRKERSGVNDVGDDKYILDALPGLTL